MKTSLRLHSSPSTGALLPPQPGPAPAVGACARPLFADGERLLSARGFTITVSEDGGRTQRPLGRLRPSLAERLMEGTAWSRRLLRTGFHHLRPLPDGGLVGIVRGRVVHKEAQGLWFESVLNLRHGRRPLTLCQDRGGRLWFGEYWRNPHREAVRIYGSENGRDWSVVHTFPSGAVRHVHGVFEDRHRQGLWVATGDRDAEVGLYFTGDGFRTLEKVAGGSQSLRAATLLPIESGLILPMDSPRQTNWVQHFDPGSGRLERLVQLPGSAFYSSRARGILAISTAVEPRRDGGSELDPRAALFASTDGYDWRPVARFERDHPRRGLWSVAWQFPALRLAPGTPDANGLFATGQSLAGLHERSLAWSATDLAHHLLRHAPTMAHAA